MPAPLVELSMEENAAIAHCASMLVSLKKTSRFINYDQAVLGRPKSDKNEVENGPRAHLTTALQMALFDPLSRMHGVDAGQ